eukprot:scaffold206515_cov20-Prasinocladus_malaysianus.AAC.1
MRSKVLIGQVARDMVRKQSPMMHMHYFTESFHGLIHQHLNSSAFKNHSKAFQKYCYGKSEKVERSSLAESAKANGPLHAAYRSLMGAAAAGGLVRRSHELRI